MRQCRVGEATFPLGTMTTQQGGEPLAADGAAAASAPQAEDAARQPDASGQDLFPSSAELYNAMEVCWSGKNTADLRNVSLKHLRWDVVNKLGLSKKQKRALEGPRRIEFSALAEKLVQEIAANAPNPSPPKPDWYGLEDEDACTTVYLVTLAFVLAETALASPTPLKTLDGLTREAVRDAILDAVGHPVNTRNGGRPGEPAETVKLIVFLEEPLHFHVALKLSKRVVFMPFKLALRERSGFASHWSTSHREFWSAVRYGTFTTPHKASVDTAAVQSASSGEALDLYAESQQPWTAEVCKKRREKARIQDLAASRTRPHELKWGDDEKGTHTNLFIQIY